MPTDDSSQIPELVPVPDFPGYLASRDGRVWTLWTRRGQKPGSRLLPYIGTIPKPMVKKSYCKGRYFPLRLWKERVAYPVWTHQIILKTFVGPCPQGLECRHLDGNPQNNALENLKWGTRLENMRDKIRHGTNRGGGSKGEQHGMSKLTNECVIQIRKNYSEGVTSRDLASRFNVHIGTIQRIVNRTKWKHI